MFDIIQENTILMTPGTLRRKSNRDAPQMGIHYRALYPAGPFTQTVERTKESGMDCRRATSNIL